MFIGECLCRKARNNGLFLVLQTINILFQNNFIFNQGILFARKGKNNEPK